VICCIAGVLVGVLIVLVGVLIILTEKTMSKRGETWSEAETAYLISAWGDHDIQEKLGTTHKNSEIYTAISATMKDNSYDRDSNQCRTKIKHLKQVYKAYKDALAVSGAGRKKMPKFFKEMDVFLGDKPEAIGLESSVEAMPAPAKQQSESPDKANKATSGKCPYFYYRNQYNTIFKILGMH
jgi:hypothetical protein